MTQRIMLDLKVVAVAYMWFRELPDNVMDSNGNLVNEKHPVSKVSLNYDFERRPESTWLLHVDVGLRVIPIAEIKVRTTFQTEYKGPIEHILKMDAMKDVVKLSMDKCLQGFNERSKVNGIAYQHQQLDMDISDALNYVRNHYEQELAPMQDGWYAKKLISFTPGQKTRILCKVPFMIMDEVFFNISGFDHRYNATKLFEHVPEPFYYTTKLRCNTIEKEKVELSGMHSVYYLICLDCALQMLVGEHADRFRHLEARGFTPQLIKNFLAWGTEYFDYTRKVFADNGFGFVNFEKRPDWNSVVRLAT